MKKKLIIFATMLFWSFAYSQSPQFDQTIDINQTFTDNTEIFPFNGGFFYGIGVNGNIAFNSDSSLVRIILKDSISDFQYLIYETYTMLDTNWSFNIAQECEETCFLDGITPTSVVIKIIDATVYIDDLLWSSNPVDNIDDLQKQAKHNKVLEKIDKMNGYIEKEGLLWQAGETVFTNMFYQEKEKLYTKCLPLGGLEFYISGIFSFNSPKDDPLTINYDYIDNFDWRNRHGATDQSSFYWDGDNDGSGWMTKPGCQFGCWINGTVDCTVGEEECEAIGGEWRTALTCWAFGAISYVEALTNLYLNQHYDADLSEQELVSCTGPVPNPNNGGSVKVALNYIMDNGVVDEVCFPYTAQATPCDVCINPQEKISIFDNEDVYYFTENQLRQAVLEYGPLTVVGMNSPWGSWNHAMELVGWDVIDKYDPSIIGVPNTSAIDDYIGATYWIYKNNYGTYNSSNGGYVYMTNYDNIPPIGYVKIPIDVSEPIISEVGNFDVTSIQCLDNDDDGYYNWGIGIKPSQCTSCPDEEDGDDNNPGLGPMNDNGTLTIIGTYTADFSLNLCNWKQVEQDDCDWYRLKGPSEQYPATGPSTGVNGDDDFYVMFRGDKCFTNKTAILESPVIDLDQYCGINISFYLHRNIYTWGNPENSYLSLDISFDEGVNWINNYWTAGDLGDQWVINSVNIPPNVTKIRFVEHSNEFSSFNDVALDKITISPLTNSNNIIITENEEWANSNILCGNLIIKPNAKLTLLSGVYVYMQNNTKIIVERGAKLIIDGGIITGDSWQGIEVWGTSSQPQTLEYQGLVKVINGGTIKNAVCGIRAVKMGPPTDGGVEVPNLSYSGGMIYTDNAVFKNNKTAVKFYQYNADNSDSYFNQTDFIIDGDLIDGTNPDYFIYLSHIDGVHIAGSSFDDQRTLDITQHVTGIVARDSKFNVDEYCVVNGNCYPSTFSDLNYGINAMTHDPMKTVTVKNSVFDKNHRSVFLSRTDNAIVLFNEFHPYTGPTMNGEDSYCLYLDYCSDYTVEENNFEHTGDQPGGIGLVINNSGADNNMIYRNDFSNLQYATLAENCNRGENFWEGLQIKCNDYWDNYQDIAVTADGEVEYPGIAHNQGADGGTEMQAGNLFSINNNGNDISDYSTFKQGPITYFHHDPNLSGEPRVEPAYYTDKYISLNNQGTEFQEMFSCPSHQSGGGGGSGGDDREGLRSEMSANQYKADSTQSLLSVLVDGGNSEVLKQEVLQTMPPEAYDLYMSLMGKSPYLSDSVLIATIEKEDILPNVIIKDILAANPQSAKSPEVMDKVEEKTVPMTDQMKAEILLGKYIVAAKEKLESQASYYRSARAAALKYLKQSYINDTLDPAAGDSLIALLESENGLHEKYQLAFAYLNKGDVESANTLVASLPSLYQFNAQQQQTYDDFAQLYGVISDLQTSAMPLDSLSAAQLQTLQQLADNSHNFAGAAARNILTIVAAYNYDEPVILPEAGMKSGIVFDLPGVSRNYKPEYVDIYPNPAMDYIIVELNKTNVNGVTLTLYDGKGNIIRTATIPGKTQDYVMGLKGLKPGIYILKADINGKNIGSKKFSIVK